MTITTNSSSVQGATCINRESVEKEAWGGKSISFRKCLKGAQFPCTLLFPDSKANKESPLMQITPRQCLMQFGDLLQHTMFGALEPVSGKLTDQARLLISVLTLVPPQAFLAPSRPLAV
jgi:hypothetical protein